MCAGSEEISGSARNAEKAICHLSAVGRDTDRETSAGSRVEGGSTRQRAEVRWQGRDGRTQMILDQMVNELVPLQGDHQQAQAITNLH